MWSQFMSIIKTFRKFASNFSEYIKDLSQIIQNFTVITISTYQAQFRRTVLERYDI